MNSNQKKVINYYKNIESKLGYTYLTWNTKHFGYYPSKSSPISERQAQDKMQDLLAKNLILKSSDLVLDAGTGRGVVATYLAKKYGARILGIDLVHFELEMAKKRAHKLRLDKKVHFFQRDYSYTKFPDNYFDAVYSMETLVHSPNIHTTLKEFLRVLKPGGRLALFEYSVASENSFNSWEKKMFDLIVTGSAMTSLPTMKHKQLGQYLTAAGFSEIKGQDITGHTLPSMYRFYRFAKYPYFFIKMLKLQKYFINTTWGVEFYSIFHKRLLRYRIFTARKKFSRG